MINTKVRIEVENDDQLPFNPNNKRKCTNDQSEAAERINEQIQEFRRKQSRAFAYKSSFMSRHDEYPSRDINFARQLKNIQINIGLININLGKCRPLNLVQTRLLDVNFRKKTRIGFLGQQHYMIGTIGYLETL